MTHKHQWSDTNRAELVARATCGVTAVRSRPFSRFAVFAWRGDGLYNLRDAIGAGFTESLIKQSIAYALVCFRQNQGLYRNVVSGRIGK